eukprot:scaffold16595_cov232-Amphora_coffeaeformis.AAC.9
MARLQCWQSTGSVKSKVGVCPFHVSAALRYDQRERLGTAGNICSRIVFGTGWKGAAQTFVTDIRYCSFISYLSIDNNVSRG